MKGIFEKAKDIFTRDTSSEGESVKLLIVIRILFASIIVYSLTNSIYCAVRGYYDAVVCFAGALVVYCVLLYCSFHIRVINLVIISNIIAVSAIIAGYVFYGPNVSIQHFFIVMVVTVYFSGYGRYKIKGVYTVFIFLLYYMLQAHYSQIIAKIPFTITEQRFLQTMNTFTSFWCVALVCYVYSRDSQHLEGKLIEYNKILRQQASTDTLTGLSNRRSANEFIEKLIKRNDEKGFCVCMCDIDFFKKVNDSYGHDIGDKVLAGVAQALVENVTDECLVSRWGGEEFLIVFPNMNGDEARIMLETIRSKIKKIVFDTGSATFSIAITYGLAEYGFDGNAENVVKEADEKLYIGKENGRDQIVF
ncbi:MAG: GGDEF domain-containing protein [Lachnospiraceae bacterium]|nr:GGDEF domain-containing protein [Lachnospiraceae bacterium]